MTLYTIDLSKNENPVMGKVIGNLNGIVTVRIVQDRYGEPVSAYDLPREQILADMADRLHRALDRDDLESYDFVLYPHEFLTFAKLVDHPSFQPRKLVWAYQKYVWSTPIRWLKRLLHKPD